MNESKSQLTRIGRIMVTVSDQERARAFYTGVLGFEVVADLQFGESARWLEVGLAGAQTTIALNMPNDNDPMGDQPGGNTGVSFETGDIDTFHSRLVEAGSDVDKSVLRIEGPVPPRFTFRDPDGNIFDVAEVE